METTNDERGRLLHRGQLLHGRYRIKDGIGEGAFGTIFRAVDEKKSRSVAVKTIPPRIRHRSSTAHGRFRREMKVIGNLDHHNIIKLYDWGETENDILFMILEFIDGMTLHEVVESNPMSLDCAIDTVRQIALAIDVAHRHGVIHRDLKPTNVMLMADGDDRYQVKVLDFGMAKLVTPLDDESIMDLTSEGVAVGTPRYIAPEQARGRDVGPMTDLYAVGLLMYEMLTGVRAVEATSVTEAVAAHVSTDPLDLDEIDMVPAPARPLLFQLLEKDPSRRLQSGTELVERLEELDRRRTSDLLDMSSAEVGPALGDVAGDFLGAGKTVSSSGGDREAGDKKATAFPPGVAVEEELELDYDRMGRQEAQRHESDEERLTDAQRQRRKTVARAKRARWFRPPRHASEWGEAVISLMLIPLALMMVGAQASGWDYVPRLAIGLAAPLVAFGWALSRQTGDWAQSFGRRCWLCCLAAIVIAHLLGPTELATELTSNPGWFLRPLESFPGAEQMATVVTWISRHWAGVIFAIGR